MAASTLNIAAYSDALVVLGTAGIVVPIVSPARLFPGSGLSRRRRAIGPARPGLAHRFVSGAVLVHRRRRQGRRRHRRARRRLFAVPDRPRTVAAPALDHAAAGVRAGRIAGAGHHRVAGRRRGLRRLESLRGDHPRRLPVAVLDRDRPRIAVEAGTADDQCRPRQLCRAAVAGSRHHPAPDVYLAVGGRPRRLGAGEPRAGGPAGRDRACRHCRVRPRAAAAAVPAGGVDALARPFYRHRLVRHHRGRRRRQPGRPVHGARRLRRRSASCRNRIPQGDRSDHRALQRAAARHFLFHRRHGHRRARIVARAGFARRRRDRPDRGEIAVDRRPRQAVPPVVAGRGRDGAIARPGRRVRVRRHRHGGGFALDRRPSCDLRAGRHFGHDGAHAGAVVGGAALRVAAAGGRRRAAGTDRAAERAAANMRSSSATGASARWSARFSRSTALPISPRIPTPRR